MVEKKQSSHFKQLVKSCILMVNIPMARRISAKSRGYMLTYAFEKKKEKDNTCECEWNYDTNESMHNIYRGH